jgi:hypothetical protein
MTADFSLETKDNKEKGHSIFQVLKEMSSQP